jgi:HemY protein
MMRIVFRLLLLVVLAVGLAIAARHNAGYILLVLPPWRAELSLNFFLLLALLGFLLGYLVVRSIGHVLALPDAVAAFRARRRQRQALQAHFAAARLLQEGRFGQALRQAEKAWADHPAPAVVALIAWRAAHALHDVEREALWAERVQAADAAGYQAARLMTATEFALEEHRYQDAQALLAELTRHSGLHLAALRLGLRAARGLGDWREVARLTRQLEKYKALTPEQARPLRDTAVREALHNLRDDAEELLRYWRTLDERERTTPALALVAAQALQRAGNDREAGQILSQALGKNWDATLVAAYGQGGDADVLERLAQAEQWLQQRPRDAVLLLTLGRLCVRRQLWGKAQGYLEAVLTIAPTRAAHIELARLFDQLAAATAEAGEAGQAQSAEKSALALRHYRAAAAL